ncbi:c9629416-1544-4667-98cf-8c932e7658a2 [Sclerotinia trifoliorum]|uniref:C9629416-1544-4667-98cf-8c932e7658a2 n=1 Tax=Sclerotinia trifoliorum TaxID=28548 RepID=A0A8H2VSM0_9HELO|nr:c9629416-1544-4667-98cf-8c932e7658a2 [Sclerotinia trifoliorum]
MADSVDRVFVHALNTVKKIPKTGASRPPPADRLRLYGLYKQAMEGDVDGVMMRPSSRGEEEDGEGELQGEELKRERDKWDAWDAQRGVSRTEAKRRYIEALIDTMHKYASTTADARELVAELEFVWDQIKNNSPSSTGSSHGPHGRRVPSYTTQPRQFQPPVSGTEGGMRVLSPMSQDDEAERESKRRVGYNGEDEDEFTDGKNNKTKWRRNVEQVLVKMTAEIAALREQIATGREYQGKKSRSPRKWLAWFIWIAIKHFLVDMALLGFILLWMRRKKDRRVEDLVREGLRIGREYVRKVLPSR